MIQSETKNQYIYKIFSGLVINEIKIKNIRRKFLNQPYTKILKN